MSVIVPSKKVAIVTEYLISPGGADRVLLDLLQIFPKATVYTAVFNEENYKGILSGVKTTFLQKITNGKQMRGLNILTPIAFESLDLREYDLIISLSAGSAKGIIPHIHQKNISIILTPPRYQWEGELNMRKSPFYGIFRFFSNFVSHYFRIWDVSVVSRIDHFVSISNYIQKKVKKIYGVDSEVIYPGIRKYMFKKVSKSSQTKLLKKYDLPSHFFLVVSRLYDYKRIERAIIAAKNTGKNLVIIGEGPDQPFLEQIAGNSEKIRFLGRIKDDEEVHVLFSSAQAVLFCGVEDFGIVPVEAMACGVPVIAFGEGGVTETVVAGETGEFFKNTEELTEILSKFSKKKFSKENLVNRAKIFTSERFKNNFKNYLTN